MKDTGAAGYLPPDRQWLSASIGDIAIVDWGNTTLTKKAYSPEGEFLGVSAAGCDGRMKFAEHKALTPVLSAIGANCGRMFLPTEDFTAIKNTITLTPKEGVCDSVFLYYLLDSVDLPKRGAGQPFISKGDIQKFPIAIPSLDEQKRIVAVLDQAFAALDRARANAEANLADARQLFGAAVEAMGKRRASVQEKRLRLGSVVTRLTNGYVGPTRDIYVDMGVPYLLARHVRSNALTFDGQTYISSAFNEKHKKSKLKAGDVLLVQSGHIGHSAVVPTAHDGHNCHAMIVISPVDEVVSGPYLSMVFNTPAMQETFQRIRSGSTVPHLTCKLVKELMIDIPPREVQDEIIAEADKLRAKVEIAQKRYETDISDLAALRQSLLQKAFSGELT
ncbi:restriction endonuclease subunit S [Rhodanobacter sp. UC4436_H3]